MACDTREDTDLTGPRTTVDHRPLGNPKMPTLSTKKLSTYPRKSTERYANNNGLLGVRRSSLCLVEKLCYGWRMFRISPSAIGRENCLS
jgi:hypothetical protein